MSQISIEQFNLDDSLFNKLIENPNIDDIFDLINRYIKTNRNGDSKRLLELVDKFDELGILKEQAQPKVFLPLAKAPKPIRDKFYKIVYTPGRKPRARDIESHEASLIKCASEEEALNNVKNKFISEGIPWNKKYCKAVQVSIKDAFKELINNKHLR